MRLNNGTASSSASSRGGGTPKRFEMSPDLMNLQGDVSSEEEDPSWSPRSRVGRGVNDLRNGRSVTPTASVHSSIISSVRTRQSVMSAEQMSRASTTASQRSARRRRETFAVANEPHPYGLESGGVIAKPVTRNSPSPSRTLRVTEQVAYRRETTSSSVLNNGHERNVHSGNHNYIENRSERVTRSGLISTHNNISNNNANNNKNSSHLSAKYNNTDGDFILSSDSETETDSSARVAVNSSSVSYTFSSVGYYLKRFVSSVCTYIYLFIVGTFLFEKWCLHVRRRGGGGGEEENDVQNLEHHNYQQHYQSNSLMGGLNGRSYESSSRSELDYQQGNNQEDHVYSSSQSFFVTVRRRITNIFNTTSSSISTDHGSEDDETRVGSTTHHHQQEHRGGILGYWSTLFQGTGSSVLGSTNDCLENSWNLCKVLLRLLLVILLLFLLWSYGSYLWAFVSSGTQSFTHGVGSALRVALNGAIACFYFVVSNLSSMTSQVAQPLNTFTSTSSVKTEPEIMSVVPTPPTASSMETEAEKISAVVAPPPPVTQTIIQYIQKDTDETLAALKSTQETIDALKLQIASMQLMLQEHGIRLNTNDASLTTLQLEIEKILLEIKAASAKEKSVEQIIEEVFGATVGVTNEGTPVSLKTMFTVLSQKEETKQPCPHELGGLGYLDIEMMIRRAIAKYDADKTGMPDLALESAGGSILSTRCTKSSELRNSVISYWGFRLWSPPNTPRTIIQPGVVPGECWAFEGSVGDVVIKLAVPAVVSGFTLEHIPKSISRYEHIDSAPKHFQVLGLQTEHDTTEVHDYGSFTYQDNDEPLQYFPVLNSTERYYPIVELKILSNHGNMRHTCIYRFRVHGQIDLTRSQTSGGVRVKPHTTEEFDTTNISN